MKRRGIIVLFVILFPAVYAGVKVHHDMREEARRIRAHADVDEIRKAIGIWRTMPRPMPENLDELQGGRPMTQADIDAIDIEVDPWGHEYFIETAGRSFTITCFGADGYPGGEGADEDIVLH